MVSRQRSLPGPASFVRRAIWSGSDRLISAVAILLPLSLLVDGIYFRSPVAWTGGFATSATAVFLIILWSLETRTIAIARGWLAVRARLSPSWIVVRGADIVTVRRRRYLRAAGLVVKLRSGPPVYLRKGDLEAGIAEALREHLGLVVTLESAVAGALASQAREAAAAGSEGTASTSGEAGREPGAASETVAAESASPADRAIGEAAIGEAAIPGSTTPDWTTPGSATPGSATPDWTTPGSATPGSATPGSATPDWTTPGSGLDDDGAEVERGAAPTSVAMAGVVPVATAGARPAAELPAAVEFVPPRVSVAPAGRSWSRRRRRALALEQGSAQWSSEPEGPPDALLHHEADDAPEAPAIEDALEPSGGDPAASDRARPASEEDERVTEPAPTTPVTAEALRGDEQLRDLSIARTSGGGGQSGGIHVRSGGSGRAVSARVARRVRTELAEWLRRWGADDPSSPGGR